MTTIKVQMTLSSKDVATAEALRKKFKLANRAQAVSLAINITDLISKILEEGGEIFVRTSRPWFRKGRIERLHFPPYN